MTIRVTIDLVPKGVGEPRRYGVIEIRNTTEGTATKGNYVASLYDRGGRLYKTVRVDGFPRKHLLAFDLLYRVLRAAVGERNPDD